MELPKDLGTKIFKGCGCVSIGIVVLLIALVAWAISLPDEEDSDEKKEVQKTEQAEKKDSIVVNAPLEGDPYKELDELIGLDQVKDEVRSLANFVKLQKQREKKGLKVPKMSLHLVFTGNPGTGKTTVARIVARIYKDLGVLKKGHTVETDRSGLVANYVGQTATKTNAVVDSALNGVLFIDEAYALVPDEGIKQDYGQEAISTLLKRMEDDRDRLIVIAAGYTDEMRDFLDANSGLRSRFSKTIEFADYTAGELAAIFRSMAKKNEFALAPDLDAGLDAAMAKLTAKRDRTFGNARFVRQLFEDATGRQANRLAESGDLGEESLKTLTLADLGLGEKKADVRAPTVEEVLAELDALVGLKPVKDEVRRLVATVRAGGARVVGIPMVTVVLCFIA